MKFYPKNDMPALDPQLFQNPAAEYRGTPFWSWNSKLDRDQLIRQIDVLKAMGMGGFHIHARTGLATEYLGNEFMDMVRACVEKAKQEQMLAWLYDEDRWPSGEPAPPPSVSNTIRASRTTRTDGELIARYHVALRDGRLAAYRRLGEG